jgi:hypothetical protein
MITSLLKSILTDAGCTLVLYESSQLANLLTDQSKPGDIIGLILQPNDVTLEVKANSIIEHYAPERIEILKQVRLEDSAENNEQTLEYLLAICKDIILLLIASGDYKKITTMVVTKILETRYDANVIGWSMPLDLYYLENKNCL